jgi:hypothetical protein
MRVTDGRAGRAPRLQASDRILPMVINPHLELRLGKADGGIQSVTVHAPVKGDSLKV